MAMPPQPSASAARRRFLAAAVSLGAHLALFVALIGVRPAAEYVPAPPPVPQAVLVHLALPRRLQPSPSGGGSAAAAPVPAPPAPPAPAPPVPAPRRVVSKIPPPPEVAPLPASVMASSPPDATLSEAQLVGAIRAGMGSGDGEGEGAGDGSGPGSGGGARACDMVRRLQTALRKDPDIQAAASRASGGGKAVLVWNGDWVRTGGQDGKGLAGVRQAILMEVGFAPEACRKTPMHGLVLIALSDTPGGARLVLGGGDWRWSDLLFAR